MLKNWGLIMDICAIQGKWTELSQICQHLTSDLVWQESRKGQLFFPLSKTIPKSVRARTQSSHLWRAHLWWLLQTCPILYNCCHLLTFNDTADCTNYVDPDPKVVSAHAPPSHCTPLCNRLHPVRKFGSLGNYSVASVDSYNNSKW